MISGLFGNLLDYAFKHTHTAVNGVCLSEQVLLVFVCPPACIKIILEMKTNGLT